VDERGADHQGGDSGRGSGTSTVATSSRAGRTRPTAPSISRPPMPLMVRCEKSSA
jgi:hypothetical protein